MYAKVCHLAIFRESSFDVSLKSLIKMDKNLCLAFFCLSYLFLSIAQPMKYIMWLVHLQLSLLRYDTLCLNLGT